MLSQYNARDIEFALIEETPPPPFPPARDRAAWEKVRAQLGPERTAAYIARGEAAAQQAIPLLPATTYLEFQRIGERLGYENPVSARRSMLVRLTLAECLEYQGRFLDPLLNLVWAMCEESSWVYPAHQTRLTDMEHPIIDLFATMTGMQLAEFDALLGADMDPLLGKRIRYEVDRRLFTPYLSSHEWHWLYNTVKQSVGNWTAVCNGNLVSAAIYLESNMSRLAEIIARAARSLDDYLETFDADGGSTEGPGYWSYGFGNYVIMSHLIEQRTNGRIAFLEGEHLRNISQFPERTLLSHNTFVNFSDCDRHISITPPLLAFLARRFAMADLMTLARQQRGTLRTTHDVLSWGLRDLFWMTEAGPDGYLTPNRHDWFPEMMWMMARYDPEDPDALVLAAKGGHNDEMHNQNDVGNIIVHVNGESVIADIGRGRYTRAYFNEERYNQFVAQSLSHSTPVPNGQQQSPGKAFAAELLGHHADSQSDGMALELKGAYPPEADLESLKRTVILHRDGPRGWVELVDAVTFATKPGRLESALTTFGAATVEADAVTLTGKHGALRVGYEADVVSAQVELLKDVDLSEGPADVNRVTFTFLQPEQTGTIRLRIEPV